MLRSQSSNAPTTTMINNNNANNNNNNNNNNTTNMLSSSLTLSLTGSLTTERRCLYSIRRLMFVCCCCCCCCCVVFDSVDVVVGVVARQLVVARCLRRRRPFGARRFAIVNGLCDYYYFQSQNRHAKQQQRLFVLPIDARRRLVDTLRTCECCVLFHHESHDRCSLSERLLFDCVCSTFAIHMVRCVVDSSNRHRIVTQRTRLLWSAYNCGTICAFEAGTPIDISRQL
jgi:hypothetical protein